MRTKRPIGSRRRRARPPPSGAPSIQSPISRRAIAGAERTFRRAGGSPRLPADPGDVGRDRVQRFGAVGKTGSIAIIERMWRTIKALGGLRARPPLTIDDLRRRAELTLRHYAYCRPHRALGGATPAEVYFGIEPAHLNAVPGPRARPGEGPHDAPFAIAYLDPERRLPFLFPKPTPKAA